VRVFSGGTVYQGWLLLFEVGMWGLVRGLFMFEEPYEVMDADFGEFSCYLVELDGGFRAIRPLGRREEEERAFAESYGG